MRINPHITELTSRPRVAKPAKKGETLDTEEQIAKLREATLELKEENLALREEIKKLREEKTPSTRLELRENVYWLLTSSERVGPFCPKCYSQNRHLASLLDGTRFAGKTRWICPICNHVFDAET